MDLELEAHRIWDEELAKAIQARQRGQGEVQIDKDGNVSLDTGLSVEEMEAELGHLTAEAELEEIDIDEALATLSSMGIETKEREEPEFPDSPPAG